MRTTTPKAIAARLKYQKDHSTGSTVLFLGAGASISAGIPSAGNIIKDLQTHELYCTLIEAADKDSYAACMSCLEAGDRKSVIDGYVNNAKINSAHLYAAHLIAEGYIDCVVTTNFDPLMLRALALYNTFPAVYDLTTMRGQVTNSFDYPAVLFLHGQSHGFWQMNTPDEMKEPIEAIRQAFIKIAQNRSWLVVGYSGKDPVFEQLASIDKFNDGLFWANYSEEPEEHVRGLVDTPNKGVSFLPSQNADNLFRELNTLLGLGDPPFISSPFSHMLDTLERIKPITIDGKEVDITSTSRLWLTQAADRYEKGNVDAATPTRAEYDRQALIEKLSSAYVNGHHDVALELDAVARKTGDPTILSQLAWLYLAWAESLRAKSHDPGAYKASQDKYAKAVKIKPDMHEAWNNWGIAIYDHAKQTGDHDLFQQSFEKYAKAVQIKPDMHEVWNNWGIALCHQAQLTGDEDLFRQSFEKYAQAVQIKPDKHEAWNNWGNTLLDQAKLTGNHDKFRQSFEKYAKAVQIKPDKHEAWCNWGNALSNEAKLKGDGDLFRQSFEKYAKAVQIKPDKHEAWNNWGAALLQAWYLERDASLLDQAIAKCSKAEELRPGSGGFNLACAYSLLRHEELALDWLEKAYALRGDAMLKLLDDRDLDNIRDTQRFQTLLKKRE